ncbi:MAG: hypothetical protein ABIP71_09920 [Verrucomicrobiota bacterium]
MLRTHHFDGTAAVGLPQYPNNLLFTESTLFHSSAALSFTAKLQLCHVQLFGVRSRNYPPKNYFGLVVLELPDDATAVQVNSTLDSFLRNANLLVRLPGRLAIVESWRVRFRPA